MVSHVKLAQVEVTRHRSPPLAVALVYLSATTRSTRQHWRGQRNVAAPADVKSEGGRGRKGKGSSRPQRNVRREAWSWRWQRPTGPPHWALALPASATRACVRRAAKTRARIAQWATEVVDLGRTQGLSAASALVRIPFPPRLLAALRLLAPLPVAVAVAASASAAPPLGTGSAAGTGGGRRFLCSARPGATRRGTVRWVTISSERHESVATPHTCRSPTMV
jgi:hypothetical protein